MEFLWEYLIRHTFIWFVYVLATSYEISMEKLLAKQNIFKGLGGGGSVKGSGGWVPEGGPPPPPTTPSPFTNPPTHPWHPHPLGANPRLSRRPRSYYLITLALWSIGNNNTYQQPFFIKNKINNLLLLLFKFYFPPFSVGPSHPLCAFHNTYIIYT